MEQQAILMYLEKNYKGFKINKRGKFPIFTCPNCNKEEVCRLVPGADKINCMACGFTGDLQDLACMLGEVSYTDTKESVMDKIYSDFSLVNKRKIEQALDFFEASGWNLTPIVKNTKKPFEMDWLNKPHSEKSEWWSWIEVGMNLGVKTGKTSGITIVDIDQSVIPADIDLLKGSPLVQQTARGWHFIYKYTDLPTTKIAEYKVDLLNDGKQAIIYPSVVVDDETGVENRREFITPFVLSEMPDDLLKLLKSKLDPVEAQETLSEIPFDDSSPVSLIDKGGRTNALMQLGGVLSKQLNSQDVEFAISVLNTKCCTPPLPQKEVKAIVHSLSKYIKRDEKALAVHIFKYLNIVEFANAKEIKDALGYPKEDVDKALAWLVLEQQLIKRGRTFSTIKRANWKQELTVNYNALPFQVPFFSKYVNLAWGDMILLGSKTKSGKTTVAINFIKQLKDQGVNNIYYIGSEAGSRFTKTAMALNLQEGDFKWDFIVDPTKIKLEPNSVTILDWLMIPNKAETDAVFKHFADQLYETQGLLIAFQQLKENNDWFAGNMCMQYPALAAKYIYLDETGLKGNWELAAVREPKSHMKTGLIPCTYDPATRLLTAD